MKKNFQPEIVYLSNNIPVILQNYEGAVAATYWWVKTGSADEKSKEAGFAHYLEHMLFKDSGAKETGNTSTGEIARTIESLGGDINAYTSFDQTVYHVTCAAQHWEKVLDTFGVMAKPQKFLKEDFNREREVILEELKKNEDSPGRQLFQSLFTSTFGHHPYGKPVIGYEKILKAAKTQDLEAFYKRQYVSGNFGLILVGPLESAQGLRKKNIIKSLEKYFGKKVFKKKEAIAHPRAVEPVLRSKSTWEVKPFDVKTPSIGISFRVPNLEHKDMAALDLLTSILSLGELSWMYQSLFQQSSLVTDISGGIYVPKDPGMIYFTADLENSTKIRPVFEGILRQLKRIQEEGPTSEECARVLTNSESERLYATQTVDGVAGRLGFLQFVMGDLNYDDEYREALRAVDAQQIKEVAQKYFHVKRMSSVLLLPKQEPNYDIQPLEKLSEEILSSSITSADEEKIQSKKSSQEYKGVEYVELPSGLRVCYQVRPQSNVFSIHTSVLGGLRLELTHPIERSETDWGSSYLMAMSWTKGAGGRNSKQIAEIVEGKAASLDGYSGRNTVGLQMTGLARNWNVLSELLSDVLLNPTFPKDELDHAKRVAEDSIRGVSDHSSQLCSKLFLETLFEKHPYGKMVHGNFDSIKSIQSEKLKAFHRAWVRPERLVISISGPIRPEVFMPWIHRLDSQLKVFSPGIKSLSLPEKLEDESPLNGPRWVDKSLGREQTHILVGGLGSHLHSEERFGIALLQNILGGQSGRLFIELREKKSLAYTVSPVSFEGLERGYIGTYIACSISKKKEALEGIRNVLEKFVEKGPTLKEMNRAKELYMGKRAMDMQSDPALAAHYGLEYLYRLPQLTDTGLAQKINRVSPKEIRKICEKYLITPHLVTTSVG